MTSRVLFAVILGAITHFFMGFLVYGILLMDFLQAEMSHFEGLFVESDQVIIGHTISSLLTAVLITFVTQKETKSSSGSGLFNGAILSLLMVVSYNFIWYFSSNLATPFYYVVDSLAFTLMGAVTGLVIGAVLSRSRQKLAHGAQWT